MLVRLVVYRRGSCLLWQSFSALLFEVSEAIDEGATSSLWSDRRNRPLRGQFDPVHLKRRIELR